MPRNPYTRALLEARPEPGAPRGARLKTIPGSPPHHREVGPGCPFAGALRADDRRVPQGRVRRAVAFGAGHASRCWRAAELEPVRMSAAPLLDVADVSKAYRLPRPRPFAPHPLDRRSNGVSFAVLAGRSFGIVGESGSGKSTLARIALALDRPDRRRGQARRAVAVRPRPGGAARHAGAHADDLSGPVRLARSAHAGRADRRRAARRARPGLAGRAARPGRRGASVRGAPAGGRAEDIRTSSRADSDSGSPSPAR